MVTLSLNFESSIVMALGASCFINDNQLDLSGAFTINQFLYNV